MRIVIASVFTLLLAGTPVLAQNATSTDSMETAVKQVDASYAATVNKMLDGKTLTPEQQKTMAAGQARIRDLMHDLLSWEPMEPIYLKVYGNTFNQSEIDSMIGFYASLQAMPSL